MSKTSRTVLIVIIGIFTWTGLVESGFCISKMRYPAYEEITSPISENSDSINGFAYCRVNGEPFDLSEGDKFLNAVFGRMFHRVTCVHPRKAEDIARFDAKYPYKVMHYSVSSCGDTVDSMGMVIGLQEWKNNMEAHKEFWKIKDSSQP